MNEEVLPFFIALFILYHKVLKLILSFLKSSLNLLIFIFECSDLLIPPDDSIIELIKLHDQKLRMAIIVLCFFHGFQRSWICRWHLSCFTKHVRPMFFSLVRHLWHIWPGFLNLCFIVVVENSLDQFLLIHQKIIRPH